MNSTIKDLMSPWSKRYSKRLKSLNKKHCNTKRTTSSRYSYIDVSFSNTLTCAYKMAKELRHLYGVLQQAKQDRSGLLQKATFAEQQHKETLRLYHEVHTPQLHIFNINVARGQACIGSGNICNHDQARSRQVCSKATRTRNAAGGLQIEIPSIADHVATQQRSGFNRNP